MASENDLDEISGVKNGEALDIIAKKGKRTKKKKRAMRKVRK